MVNDSLTALDSIKLMLSSHFKIKDLEELKYFFGLEVLRSAQGIFLSQRKYVLDLLTETGHLDCKPLRLPLDHNVKLSIEDGKVL